MLIGPVASLFFYSLGVPAVSDDGTPTSDRCPECGREGRTLTVANFAGALGAGNRALPLRGLELELATHVGAVTIAAGKLDAAMSALRGIAGAATLDAIAKTWGRSGTELTRELRKIISDPSLNTEWGAGLSDICDRYDSLYLIRNNLIHSFRPGRGTERLDVVRPAKSTKANPITMTSQMLEVQRLGLAELIDLYYDIDDLTHDVRNLFYCAVGIIG